MAMKKKEENNPTPEEFEQKLAEAGMSERQKKYEKLLHEQETEAKAEETAIEKTLPPTADTDNRIAELEDKLLRTMAEMQNLRNRTKRDIEEARQYGITNIARDLITVLENLRLAENSIPQEEIERNELFKNISEGVKLTSNELLNVFKKHGIKRIDPMGEKFDHNYHQAMVEIPTDDAEPGTVVQVMHAGYVINDRLLRPAMVGVAKASTTSSSSKNNEEEAP